MTEEEKKSYNFYKKCNECDLDGFEYFSEESKKQIKYMETLLNLIEKQNNRLEQLKKENDILDTNYGILRGDIQAVVNELGFPEDTIISDEFIPMIKENYIPKSVIREKIEELKEIHKEQDWTQKQGFYYDCYNELLGGE